MAPFGAIIIPSISLKIDFVTFINNLEIVSPKDQKTEKTDKQTRGFKNDPNCLLVIKKNEKISRNEKCLASGKKYKHCCGALL